MPESASRPAPKPGFNMSTIEKKSPPKRGTFSKAYRSLRGNREDFAVPESQSSGSSSRRSISQGFRQLFKPDVPPSNSTPANPSSQVTCYLFEGHDSSADITSFHHDEEQTGEVHDITANTNASNSTSSPAEKVDPQKSNDISNVVRTLRSKLRIGESLEQKVLNDIKANGVTIDPGKLYSVNEMKSKKRVSKAIPIISGKSIAQYRFNSTYKAADGSRALNSDQAPNAAVDGNTDSEAAEDQGTENDDEGPPPTTVSFLARGKNGIYGPQEMPIYSPAPDNSSQQLRPVVMTYPGKSVDTRLNVFDLEFHVHSDILVRHSGWFKKYLFSPSEKRKFQSASNTSLDEHQAEDSWVVYDYVTRVFNGQNWSLVCNSASDYTSQMGNSFERKFDGNKAVMRSAFTKIIQMLYSRPYDIVDPAELIAMTKLAENFQALPTMSDTVYDALIHSESFGEKFADSAVYLLKPAAMLRQRGLFEDCLIVAAGRWKLIDLTFEEMGIYLDENLIKTINDLQSRLNRRLAYTQHQILRIAHQFRVQNVLANVPFFNCLPEYYSNMDSYFEHTADWNPTGLTSLIRDELKTLLKNNLALELNRKAQTGKGQYRDVFLCIQVKDEHIPWLLSKREEPTVKFNCIDANPFNDCDDEEDDDDDQDMRKCLLKGKSVKRAKSGENSTAVAPQILGKRPFYPY